MAKITRRKRAEEALRQSEERFRSTLDGMLEGCQINGFDWRYLYVNDAMARYGRRAKEELLGHTMMEMYPGIEDTEVFASLRRCMEQRIPQRMKTEFTFPDGDTAWLELAIQPVPEGIFILSLDITERKRAEDALRESEERFRVSLMNSPVVVFSQDSELRYTWIHNPVPGFAVEDILGKTDEDLLPPEAASRLTVIKRQVLESGVGTREEIQATIRGEVTFHDLTVEPLRDATGTIVGITGASMEITDRRRAEEALQKAREELEAKVEHQLLTRNPHGLTFRELTVLHKVAAGRSDKEIGIELGISPLTAQKHVSNILAKMQAASRTAAVARALREGLLD